MRIKLFSTMIFLTISAAIFAQGVISNGDMSEWTSGNNLPDAYSITHPKQSTQTDAINFFKKDPMGYKGTKNALKMFRNHSNAPSGRFFITPYAFLEDGIYVLTFYLKGNGWLRSVNLVTENGMPSTGSTSYDETYVWQPMGSDTDFKNATTRVTLSNWTKYTHKYEVKQGTYCLGINHNNYKSSGGVDTLWIADISLKPYEAPKLTELKVAGVIIPNFSSEIYTYEYKLPYSNGNTNFPAITYTAGEDVSVNVTPATNLSGTESARTATIKVTNNDDTSDYTTYKIIFVRAGGPNNAQLDGIEINGERMTTFSMSKTSYNYCLPYTTTSNPVIHPLTFAEGATYILIPAVNIFGTEAERTAHINVESEDKTSTQSYYITYNVIPELDLILAIGQSNMAGRGVMDPSKGDQDALSGAWLFDLYNQWEPASNPMNRNSEIKDPKKYQGMNPSYMVAKKVSEVTGRPMGMVVNARGATKIESWLKGATDGYYASSIKRSKEAQKWGKFKAIIWHQGEGNISAASKYITQLKSLVGDLRADLNDPELFFVAGELSHWRSGTTGTNTAIFNAMIDTISKFLPYSGTATTEGLQPIVTSSSSGLPDYNDPHFDRESQLILGERYADIILNNVYKNQSTEPQRFFDKNIAQIYTKGNMICVKLNETSEANVRVSDIMGRPVIYTHFSQYIEIPVYTKGIYLVSVGNKNAKVIIR